MPSWFGLWIRRLDRNEPDEPTYRAIYIPDLIKVDLSTPGVRFAGSGPGHPTNPDDPGFSRLSIFGGDVLQSDIQDPFGNDGLIPGGWPNGRRFGDDVVDIAVTAIISDLRSASAVYSRGGRNRRRERQRHRFQQDVPVRRHSAERPHPRASGSKSESDSLTALHRGWSRPDRELQLRTSTSLGRSLA